MGDFPRLTLLLSCAVAAAFGRLAPSRADGLVASYDVGGGVTFSVYSSTATRVEIRV